MTMKRKKTAGYTRRQFLKGLPIGMVAAVAVGVVGGRLFKLATTRKPPSFPEGSIFTPSKEIRRRL